MRVHAPFRPDQTEVQRFRAALAAWTLEIVAWFIEFAEHTRVPALAAAARAALKLYAPDLAADLRHSARQTRILIGVLAFQRFCRPVRNTVTQRPSSAPRGFVQRRARTRRMRHYVHAVTRGFNAGSLAARARKLAAIIENPEAYVARVIARARKLLAQGPKQATLIARRPPALMLHADAAAFAPACADTS